MLKVQVNGVPISFDHTNRKEEMVRVFRELHENNEIVQEVVMDGIVIQDNYYDEIFKAIEHVRQLHIFTTSEEALVADLSIELRNYLPKVLRALDSIPDLLYGEMSPEDWKLVVQLLEGMNWVSQATFHLQRYAEKKGESDLSTAIEQFLQTLAPLLTELEHSLQEKDFTTSGDLLKYEIPEVFKTLSSNLGNGDMP